MKQHPRPLISKTKVEAIAATILFALTELAALLFRLGKPRKTRRLEKLLRRAEREVECTIFMQATQELGIRSRLRPRLGARAGFRKQRSTARLIVKCGRVRLRNGSPFERCMRLLNVMRDPTKYLARAKRRLRHGYVDTRLRAFAPPANVLSTRALAPMPALVDSS